MIRDDMFLKRVFDKKQKVNNSYILKSNHVTQINELFK